ncbi:MAG TPA: VWA containing CoxE family protein, partial [Arthrobacter sp.]|nr:VWA containing CoxE family protein [Arthrobacter sp.]
MAGTTQDTSTAPPTVEAATLSAAFVTALRRAGLSCSPDRAVRLAEALRLIPPADVERLYWASRVVLVSARGQLPVFDAVFSAVFRGGFDPSAHRTSAAHPPPGSPEQARTRPSPAGDRAPGQAPASQQTAPAVASAGPDTGGDGDAPEREAVLAMASAEERLHGMSFAQLTEAEVLEIRRLASRLLLATPARLSRRTRKS